jgi:hypothetical protein
MPSQSLGNRRIANPPVAAAAESQNIPLNKPIQSSPKRPIGQSVPMTTIPTATLAIVLNLLIFSPQCSFMVSNQSAILSY